MVLSERVVRVALAVCAAFVALVVVQWCYFPFYVVVVSSQGSLFVVLRL